MSEFIRKVTAWLRSRGAAFNLSASLILIAGLYAIRELHEHGIYGFIARFAKRGFLYYAGVALALGAILLVHYAARRQRMQDAAMAACPGDTWPCPVCREKILKGATKCTKCGSELGWRRYVNFGTANLALATALVSVIAASMPTLRHAFEDDDSDVRVTFVGFVEAEALPPHTARVSVLVSNNGTRIGAVRGARLLWRPSLDEAAGDMRFSGYSIDRNPVFVAPKSSMPLLLDIDLSHGEKPMRLDDDETGSLGCWLVLNVVNASGMGYPDVDTSSHSRVDMQEAQAALAKGGLVFK